MNFHAHTLSKNIEALGLEVSIDKQQSMLTFLEFLLKWNKAYNLTAITDPEKMLTHHLLDSLSIAAFIQGEFILDVGTGAGFPGVPLSICFPEKKFTLIDSRGKKTRFLQQAKSLLKLDNVEIVNERMEKYQTEKRFDVIISRAVGNSLSVVNMTTHLASENACWLMMKGNAIKTELAELHEAGWDYSVEALDVPGIKEARQLIKIIK